MLDQANSFAKRHLGPDDKSVREMLQTLGLKSFEELLEKTLPPSIRWQKPLDLPEGLSEQRLLDTAWGLAKENKVFRSYIGQGYYDTLTPPVILRKVLENPGWYTAYTPYQ